MDILAVIQVAEAAFDLGIKWSDAQALYKLYQGVKTAGKLDLAAMAKSGELQADINVIARVAPVLAKLLSDPTQGPRVRSLLAGFST